MAKATSITRRQLLASAAAFTLAPSIAAPVPRRLGGGFHLVDGWILTDQDLLALGLDAR